MSLELVIGNRNYSSWSLRGWLLVELSGAAYQETLVPLFRPDTHARLLQHSPTAKVPVLKTEDAGVIWDSLAIAEYLAERFPEAAMWPRDVAARAMARSVCLWATCRQRFGQSGPYLFGELSIADAYFAPVASRLRSYAVQLPEDAAAYVDTIFQWPAFQRWLQAALKE